ncbi:hypothetical protein HUU05_10965 [candidate division KSB1 bacterium]|nr:hypothetical protein [candidate division KSB1 bacterium]
MIPNVKSRILRRRLPVGLLLATTLFAQSRDLRFDHSSIEQGLSHLSVGPVVQDLQGFLWFGAGVGLNKYDGHNFTVYKHDPVKMVLLTHGEFTWTNAFCVTLE